MRHLPAKKPVTEHLIRLARGQRVILDSDLATIYGVSTTRLNQQVQRNLDRFPADFMFRLSQRETQILILQTATSSSQWGGRRGSPRVFTEHGAIMLAAVLNTPVAIRASVQVVRAFVKLRRMMSASRQILQRLDALEKTSSGHDNHIRALFETIREMMDPEAPPPRRIGFKVEEKARHYRT